MGLTRLREGLRPHFESKTSEEIRRLGEELPAENAPVFSIANWILQVRIFTSLLL